MIYTKEQVFEACDKIAVKYGFEPRLIKALCMQESGKTKDGSFAPDRARLEQGFYSRYIEKESMPTTNEVLLSASYGILQMMGQSLKEIGYFEAWFNQQDEKTKQFLGSPYSEISLPKAINWYCVNLDAMIEWGCKWLDRKRKMSDGNTMKMLCLWNGDLTGKYASEVIDKRNKLT